MATLTRYFRTDSTTGGDGTADTTTGATRAYESLDAALAAEATDLVTAGDIIHFITTTPGLDTNRARIAGAWVMDATNYIIIEAQGSARHNGVSREQSSSGYQIKPVSADAMYVSDTQPFVRIIGLELAVDATGFRALRFDGTTTTSDFRCDECLFVADHTTLTGSGLIDIDSGDAIIVSMTNSLVIAQNTRAIDARGMTLTMDHCGISVTGSQGGLLAEAGTTVTNSWAIGDTGTGDFWTGGTAPSGSNNASEDTTATVDYTSSIASITVANEFTSTSGDPALADFTLLDSNLNAAGTGSEAIDITGASRTGTADIGPFNFAASAGGSPWYYYANQG